MSTSKTFKILTAALMASTVCACSLDSLKGVGDLGSSTEKAGKQATVDAKAVTAQGAKLVTSYAVAMAGVTEAQKDLAKAYKLDDLAKELDAQQKSLKSGNIKTSDDADKIVELSEKANKAITEKMEEKTELDSASKTLVSTALVKYGVGAASTAVLVKSSADFAKNTKTYVSSLPWTQKASALTVGDLPVAVSVSKEVPSLAKDLVTTGKTFVELAKEQGIDTSKAQKQMSSIAGF